MATACVGGTDYASVLAGQWEHEIREALSRVAEETSGGDGEGYVPAIGIVYKPANPDDDKRGIERASDVMEASRKLGVRISSHACDDIEDAVQAVASMTTATAGTDEVDGIVLVSSYGAEDDRMLYGGIGDAMDLDARGGGRELGWYPCDVSAALSLLHMAMVASGESDDADHPFAGKNIAVTGAGCRDGMLMTEALMHLGANVLALQSDGRDWLSYDAMETAFMLDAVVAYDWRYDVLGKGDLDGLSSHCVLINAAGAPDRAVGAFDPSVAGSVDYLSSPSDLWRLSTLELLRRVCGLGESWASIDADAYESAASA